MLAGDDGPGTAFAMRLVVRAADARRPRLIPITGAHVDSCSYHGQATLDFVDRLVAGGQRSGCRPPSTWERSTSCTRSCGAATPSSRTGASTHGAVPWPWAVARPSPAPLSAAAHARRNWETRWRGASRTRSSLPTRCWVRGRTDTEISSISPRGRGRPRARRRPPPDRKPRRAGGGPACFPTFRRPCSMTTPLPGPGDRAGPAGGRHGFSAGSMASPARVSEDRLRGSGAAAAPSGSVALLPRGPRPPRRRPPWTRGAARARLPSRRSVSLADLAPFGPSCRPPRMDRSAGSAWARPTRRHRSWRAPPRCWADGACPPTWNS